MKPQKTVEGVVITRLNWKERYDFYQKNELWSLAGEVYRASHPDRPPRPPRTREQRFFDPGNGCRLTSSEQLWRLLNEAQTNADRNVKRWHVKWPVGIYDRILEQPQGHIFISNARTRWEWKDRLEYNEATRKWEPNGKKYRRYRSFQDPACGLAAAWYTNPKSGTKWVRIEGWGSRITGRPYIQAKSFDRDWCRMEDINYLKHHPPYKYDENKSKRKIATQEKRISFARKCILKLGPPGQDDRVNIAAPHIVAQGPLGILICDAWDVERRFYTFGQVVVKDPSTGLRHHLTVPAKFVNPNTMTHIRAMAKGGEAWLVRAAIAWTYDMKPEEYNPDVES